MSIPRRDVIRHLTLLGAGGLVGAVLPKGALPGAVPEAVLPGGAPAARNRAEADRLERIGLQLRTVRDRLEQDFEGTLERVARIGYREVEFAGYHGREPEEVRSALERAGLEAPASHVPFQSMMSDWERTIVAAHAIGHRHLVVGSIPSNRRQTLSGYRRVASLFNRAASTARVTGLNFAYRNHAFEFEAMEGRVPYDVLLEETDPDRVHLELDLHGIRRGGHSPLEYIDRLPGRIRLMHVKDTGVDGGTTPVGEGTTDFGPIFARSREAGVQHFFVEHDDPEDSLASARTSYDHLRDLEF